MIQSIIQAPDQRLTDVSLKVSEFNDHLGAFADDLNSTRRAHKGYGLAAPQVGVPLRIISVNPGITAGFAVMVNPEIVKHGNNKTAGEEGCLSIDKGKTRFTVKRWDTITVRFQTVLGQPHERMVRGLAARIIQHEIDHLDGKLIGASA